LEARQRLEETAGAELRAGRQKLTGIIGRSELELNRLWMAAVSAGKLTEQDVIAERAYFRARIQAIERRTGIAS